MAARRLFLDELRLLWSPDFWSFRVVHALLGGVLTIAGAAGALFIIDGLRSQIADIEDRMAALESRNESIRTTLAEFRVVQSNGVILGAISTADAIHPSFRDAFVKLMFSLRHTPALALVQESDPDDLAGFRRAQEELDRLIEIAVSPQKTSQSWNDIVDFEMRHERRLMEVREIVLAERDRLAARKRELQADVDSVTLIGFLVQQVGFVVVLLAGLVHEHAAGARAPAPRAEPDRTAR